jgi:ATP-dependent Clp protease protease subunit
MMASDLPDAFAAGLGEALFARRLVQVRGPLDDAAAAEVAARLMALDALGDDPIDVTVDSAGGTLDAALAVADTIDLLGVPVHALCLGRAEGPAVLVLAVSERREATPNARIRLTAPPVSGEARTADVEAWVDRQRDRLDRFVVRLAQAAGQRIERVHEDVSKGRTFDPEEAVAFGIIDNVRRRGASAVGDSKAT